MPSRGAGPWTVRDQCAQKQFKENLQEITNKVINDFVSHLLTTFKSSFLILGIFAGPKREWFNGYITFGSRSVDSLVHGHIDPTIFL